MIGQPTMLPWYEKHFHVEQCRARNKLAKEFVALRRDGMSAEDIADTRRMSASHVRRVMCHACPPLVTPSKPQAVANAGRPKWTIPDKELMRLAREGREEIAAAEAYLRVIRRRPELRIARVA